MKAGLTCIFILISLRGLMTAQQADSLQLAGNEIIGRQIEHLEVISEAGIDLSEITEDLEYLLDHPINLNDADKKDLKRLPFLTGTQIKNLIDYREKYGSFLSIYELKVIDGLGRNTLEKIMPFVIIAPAGETSFDQGRLFRGRHDILIRFQRKLLRSEGFFIPDDTLQAARRGSFFLGNPNRYYLRYRYTVGKRISLGFIAEKDPGEMFFRVPPGLSASLREGISMTGFDYYSFHVGFESKGVLKYVVAGDYHARFGQGLVLWSGLSFSGSSDPSSVKRFAPGIRPNTSANENQYFRGGAFTMAWKGIEMSALYSFTKVDANIVYEDSSDLHGQITSLLNSGYHRTLNELEDKNRLGQQHLGGHISYAGDRFQLGATICHSWYSLMIGRDDVPANLYRFRGSHNLVAGLDYDIILRRTNFFGEVAMSRNGGWAVLAGLTHTTDNGSMFGLLVREYKPQYQNLLAQAAGKRDNNANERGIKVLLEFPLFRRLSFQSYYDHYSYPWISARNINIQRGQEFQGRLLYSDPEYNISIKYKYRTGNQNSNDPHGWFDRMVNEQKQEMQIMARHRISPSFSIKLQAGYAVVRRLEEAARHVGSLLLMDVYYQPERCPMKITFRYALFHTDDYGSRIYAYENDVLYASSMPAYYGKGFRTYLLLKYSPVKWLDGWIRFSLTCFTDRNTISSGPDEIKGNKLPEVKLQLRVKL